MFDTHRLARLALYAQQLIDDRQFAGVAWSLRHHGRVIDDGVCGHADHGRTETLQRDTIYRLYSMTKPVVSVRCLQLIEAGKLRLDDPVSRWLPAFADQHVLTASGQLEALTRPISVEDLLMHRAGLSYDFLPDCAVATRYREAGLAADGHRSLAELVALIAAFPLASQPGERWYYSYATDVLAHLLECVTDRPLDDDLQQSLFGPLSMSDTGFCVTEDQQHRLADMFGQRELGEVPVEEGSDNQLLPMNVDQSYPSSGVANFLRGGIGLFSTISDYEQFMNVLLHGRSDKGEVVLSAPMLDLLWQNRLRSDQMPISIGGKAYSGYGWGLTGRVMAELNKSQQLSVPGEGGWAGAASTHFWVDRRYQLTGLVMAQYLGSNRSLGFDMQALAYAALSQPVPS